MPDLSQATRGDWYGLWTQAVDKVLPVVLLLYLARTLDADVFGVYAFVVAYLAFFQVVSDYSIDTVLVRTMSQRPDERRDLLRAGLGLKLALAAGSAAVATAFVVPASAGRVPPLLMLVASLSLPTALGGAYRSYFRSVMAIRNVFLMAMVRATLLATGVIGAVAAGAGLETIFVAMAIANLSTFLLVAFVLRGEVRPGLRVDRAIWTRLVRGALPLMGNAFAMTVSLRAGHVLLMSMQGPVAVGQLGAAARVTEAFTLLPEALMISMLPLMAGLHASDAPALLRAAGRAARYLVVTAGVPVLVCATAGDELMALLFGRPFASAGSILSLLSFTALLSATGTVLPNLLVAAHAERTLERNTAVFAVVGVALSVVLIGSHGAVGAAAAMLATSVASQVSLSMLPSTRAYVAPTLRAAVRPFAAVLVAVAVGRMLPIPAAAAAVAALVAYVPAVWLLGVVEADDAAFVRGALASVARAPEEKR